jgi:hypothetical protein
LKFCIYYPTTVIFIYSSSNLFEKWLSMKFLITAAERIMRKWRGEKSPVCSQSLNTRVRRQGTGRYVDSILVLDCYHWLCSMFNMLSLVARKTMPRKYDVKLLGNTEKLMELDEEKLEIEEEEHPVSTFTGSEGQACELITEADDLQLDPFQGKGLIVYCFFNN